MKVRTLAMAAIALMIATVSSASAGSVKGIWTTHINGYTTRLTIISDTGGFVRGNVLATSPQGFSAGAPFRAVGSAKQFDFAFANGNSYSLRECSAGICGTFTRNGSGQPVTFRR
ncbi:hypothetical protein K8R03_01675 [Candidatus Kaiserbacteria bacterium]|nr:hypothetical protein [Candidatus Kaiserbacteria bacterium]